MLNAQRAVRVTSLALVVAVGFLGCSSSSDQPASADGGVSSGDAGPMDANVVMGDGAAADGSREGGVPTDAGSDTSASSDAGQVAPTQCKTPPCINVINHCSFPLWIHAKNNAGNNVTLMPDNAKLGAAGQPDSIRQYDVPASWPAARVNAYWIDPMGAAPDANAFDKVEMTIGGGVMNYNITYVDYLALPSQMEAIGPSCPKTGTFDPNVACAVPSSSVLTGCPAGLLDGKRCLSAGLACSTAQNAGSALCHALDGAIQTCATQNPATCGIAAQENDTTDNAYGCSGYFDSQPPNCSPASATCHKDGNKWCAALNRGMLSQPDSTDTSLFYQTAPYNEYAKWVHATCPGIYAFAYDDYPSGAGQSGFRSCTADRLDITFCPGG